MNDELGVFNGRAAIVLVFLRCHSNLGWTIRLSLLPFSSEHNQPNAEWIVFGSVTRSSVEAFIGIPAIWRALRFCVFWVQADSRSLVNRTPVLQIA